MKTTLRELLEEEVNRIKERMNQLHKNIAEYSAAENYDAAAKNQIKHDTLFMVWRNLESILNHLKPMKINSEQLNEVLNLAHLDNKKFDLRYGQSFFNALCKLYPECAESIRGTDVDPFYNDSKLDECIKFIFSSQNF